MSARTAIHLAVGLALVFAVESVGAQSGPAPATGPSFDCRKATTPAEKAICASLELGQLDGAIGLQFKKARALASPYLRATLLDEQVAWLKARNKCGGDAACLRASLQKRSDTLATFTDEYEHPREERHGPFLVRYIRGAHWDILAPVIVSGPPGPGTALLKKTLQESLQEGCEDIPEDGTHGSYSLSAKVVFADERFLTLSTSHDYFCGGAYPDSFTSTDSYDVSTGGKLEFSGTFSKELTVDKVLALAKQHDRKFEMDTSADCLAAVKDSPIEGVGIVGGNVVLSPSLPHAVAACGFVATIPLDVLRPYVLKSSPLASYGRN